MIKYFFFFLLSIQVVNAQTNIDKTTKATAWADSVFNSLTPEQRIAQLMVVRLSTYDFQKNKAVFFDSLVTDLVRKYNIGGLCLFQGNPADQARIINSIQNIAQTPLMICIDAEWGLGMRMFDSVMSLPKQMMLGAMQNQDIVYQYGKLVAMQCKRLGINVNYAPVVDINNNPDNPVINDRSFGEDKYKVAAFGIQYMKGLQDNGIMACAKHFPGHGDVNVDSHFDLPVIKKSFAQLDSLELYPFKEIFKNGVASTMIAHLYVPALDSSAHRATSISKNTVTDLLRNKLGFQGLTFTDALEMQGVKKYFPNGEAAVQSLIAGNDMLCLPEDVPLTIQKIKDAIAQGRLSWEDINFHCKKVLDAKFKYGGGKFIPINLTNIVQDVNKGIPEMKKLVAENAITLLSKSNNDFSPLKHEINNAEKDIAYIGIGLNADNLFSKKMKSEFNADVLYFDYKQVQSSVSLMIDSIKSKYKKIVIGIHNLNRPPLNHFGISNAAINLVNQLQAQTNSMTIVFGNAYAVKNFCTAKNLLLCYEDDDITQSVAIEFLKGNVAAKGRLPVSVCDQYKFGYGINFSVSKLPAVNPDEVGLDLVKLQIIDSIANHAIAMNATSGCDFLIARNGKIAYQKSFGYTDYTNQQKVSNESVYDIASVTKICATTLALMKLYEEGKLDIRKTIGDYLPSVKNSNKEKIVISDLMLHQAGLIPYIPFYKETVNDYGMPSGKFYSSVRTDYFSVPVAKNLFMRKDWTDSMFQRILKSPLSVHHKYVYSDLDFIFLGKIAEAITGKTLDQYVKDNFYTPLGLTKTGFKPKEFLNKSEIVPTEWDGEFRQQLLQGDVNDAAAAMFGGVSGHAGLFSNTNELAVIMQMLLNGGTFNGKQFLKPETIHFFTKYSSDISRRGLGFDKPEKDNAVRKEPYPCLSASSETFGHTGFTGTCVWVDPSQQLVFIFLSNRVMKKGNDNTKLQTMNIRGEIFEAVYKALIK